jgi:hypothetical protein
MIRLVTFMRRNQRLSLGDFHERLRKEYGPLVAAHQTPLGILRYTQTHRLEDEAIQTGGNVRGRLEQPYDAVDEIWFESLDAVNEAWTSERGKRASAALLATEAELVDLPESPLWLAYEYPQFSHTLELPVARPNSGLVKSHLVVRQIAGMTFDQAQHHWLTVHGPFARSVAPALNVHSYLQVHRFETPLEAELRASRGVVVEPYLGHGETWRSLASAPAISDNRVQHLVVEDEARFIDLSRTSRSAGYEQVFVYHR